MKKFTFLMSATLIFLAATFSSCEKVADELQNSMEVTIYTDLTAPFLAMPDDAKSGSATFSETAVIDITQNEDLADYLESIESIEVTKVKIQITSISSEGLILEKGTFSVIDNTNADRFEFSTPNNLPLVLGTQFELPTDAEGWDTVNKIIATMHSATVGAEGMVNNEYFEIGFNFIISVKVKANP